MTPNGPSARAPVLTSQVPPAMGRTGHRESHGRDRGSTYRIKTGFDRRRQIRTEDQVTHGRPGAARITGSRGFMSPRLAGRANPDSPSGLEAAPDEGHDTR